MCLLAAATFICMRSACAEHGASQGGFQSVELHVTWSAPARESTAGVVAAMRTTWVPSPQTQGSAAVPAQAGAGVTD